MSKIDKFLGLFKKKTITPNESVQEDNSMVGMETKIQDKMDSLTRTIQKIHKNGNDTLTSKQIIDLVVSIDPIIADLGKLLASLDPQFDSPAIEDARLAYEENAYLRDVLAAKVKDFH